MGKAKTAIIIVAVIFGLLIVAAIAAASMVTLPATDIAPVVDKYEGLTEEQITRVKITFERCETSAFIAGAGSETATQEAMKKCAELEARQIANYREDNSQ